MSRTNVYKRLAVTGLALMPLCLAPAATADDLGGFSTWTDEPAYTGPVPSGPGHWGRRHGYLHAVCVDPAWSGYENHDNRHYTVNSIKEAMHVVAPGGVIEVKPGAVADNLVVYKPVELRAGDCHSRRTPPQRRGWSHYMRPAYTHLKEVLRPVLVAQDGRPCVSIRTRGRVIISGFRLGAVEHGRGACVYQTRGELLLSDNVLHGARGSTSVYVRNGSLWMISNTVRGGRIGIDIASHAIAHGDPRVFVHRNRLTGMHTGILVRADVPVEISENQIASTVGEGIRRVAGRADIRSNIFSENTGSALVLEGSNSVHVSDNKFVYNTTAVTTSGVPLHTENFRFNHVACNEEAGVYDIPTNSIAYNPAKERRGWFARRKHEDAMAYCSELVHSPVRLGRRDGPANEGGDEGGLGDGEFDEGGEGDLNGQPDGHHDDHGDGRHDGHRGRNGHWNGESESSLE